MKINVDDYIPARVETADTKLTELEQYLIVSLLSDLQAITSELFLYKGWTTGQLKHMLIAMDGLVTYLKKGKADLKWIKAGEAQSKAAKRKDVDPSSFKTMMTFENELRKTAEGKKLMGVIEDDDNYKGRSKFFWRFENSAKNMDVKSAVIKAYEVVNKRFLVEQQRDHKDV